jgi:predicted anti-sigma-YlaC factor YlaD
MSEQTGSRGPGLTITCTEVVEVVTDYLEGSVDDGLRAEIEAHLALCPGCDAYLDQMRETIRVMGHVPVESLSDTARDELMNAFRTFHTPST